MYFVECVGAEAVKIGIATNLAQRLATLRTCNPFPLEVRLQIPGDESREARIHEKFRHLRMRGEWFALTYEIHLFMAACRNEERAFLSGRRALNREASGAAGNEIQEALFAAEAKR